MKQFVNRKNNKTESYLLNHIKVNDTVIIKDGSYMLDSELNEVHGIDFINKHKHELLTIISINVSTPTNYHHTLNSLGYQNNCIVKGFDNKIYYCSRINLEKFTK